MKRVNLSCILRGLAFSALTNMALPVAEAWAADEVQVLRRAPVSSGAAMSFTTFQQEQMAITQSLPCKWISKDGRLGPSYGNARYDFLCKGGNFATVSLYLDKTSGDGVGKVRLLYRDWQPNANPNAGEAAIAQQFLQHVAGRFVPASISGDVMDGFWGNRARSWSQGGVSVKFDIDKGEQFNVRRMEISTSGGEANMGVQVIPFVPAGAGLTKPQPVPETQVIIYDKDGKKVTPTDAGLSKPMAPINPVRPLQPAVAPVPLQSLPTPGTGMDRERKDLVVPTNAPAGGAVSTTNPEALVPASPAELNTAPAPESKVVPQAATQPSATLVPNTQDIKGAGSARAPSNFDIYNKASDLLKSVEDRAQTSKVEEAKVTASKPASPTLKVAPSTEVVPNLKPVPTPGQGATPAGEGLGVAPATPTPAAVPAVDQTGQPINYNGPRSSEARPLPQLKFVPKAEPLQAPDEVLQFEDEKSKL